MPQCLWSLSNLRPGQLYKDTGVFMEWSTEARHADPKGEIAKADFQLFLILDPPKTLVKILYIDYYEQICAQYPPNLQDLCKLLLLTTSC